MTLETNSSRNSKALLWTGRVITALVALFLLMDAVMKFIKPRPVIEATAQLGYRESVLVGLGAVLTICTLLYLIPPTAVLGAILLTGYLGGAVASHLRAGDSAFKVCFPAVFGALVWIGLVLRDPQLRRHVPLRR